MTISSASKPLARLGRLRFCDLKYTRATLLLTKGGHTKGFAEMLGHSSISMTLDTYSHMIPKMGEAHLARWRTS
jgi:integrase